VRTRNPVAGLIAALIVVAASVLISAPTADAQQVQTTVNAEVDGRDVNIAVSGDPIPLYPDKIADITVEITNNGSEPIEIASAQLVGKVLGLTFFKYTTGMESKVSPGQTGTVRYELDLTDLQHQAVGLMDTQLIVRNSDKDVVATVDTVADIRGSLLSVYGLLGLALVVLTVLAFINAILAIARHKGSPNRLRRGLQLLSPGIGVGLILVFTASVARWWVPRTEWWILTAAITGAVFFALGYFSPTPDADEGEIAEVTDESEDGVEAGVAAGEGAATVLAESDVADDDPTMVQPRDDSASAKTTSWPADS